MKELYEETKLMDQMPIFKDSDIDPWWDPITPIKVGTSKLSLKPLMMAGGSDWTELDVHSSEDFCKIGILRVKLTKRDKFSKTDSNDQFEKKRKDMLEQDLNFTIEMDDLSFDKINHTNPFITYSFNFDCSCVYQTAEAHKTTQLNFSKLHSIQRVTSEHLDYLDSRPLMLNIYAYPYFTL